MNKQNIPIIDLKGQYLKLKDEIWDRWDKICNSSSFILGEEVEKFEEEFASYTGRKHAVGASSGTSALHLALEAAGARGAEVLGTPFTFIASASAVLHSGGSVKWADICPDTYCIDSNKIEEALSPKTRVILPVHLYGASAEMDSIMQIARKHNLKVVEDAAQSHGGLYKNKKSGSMGDLACFSFYPTKNLGAFGEAGAVVCDDDDLADHLRRLRAHGSSVRYLHEEIGYNYRIDALQAAVLRVKLKYLDEWNDARRKIAAFYNDAFKNLPVRTPIEPKDTKHVYHQYVILTSDRDCFAEYLSSHGIANAVHYPIPLHLQPCFSHMGLGEGSFPVSEQVAKECISLPSYPDMSDAQVEYVVEKVLSFYGK